MKKFFNILPWILLAIMAYGWVHPLLPWHKPLTHPTFTEKLFGDHYDHD